MVSYKAMAKMAICGIGGVEKTTELPNSFEISQGTQIDDIWANWMVPNSNQKQYLFKMHRYY